MSPSDYSEDSLVEQPAIALFEKLGWESDNCFKKFEEQGGSPLGRENRSDVVLVSRLRPVLETLNPEVPPEAIGLAIEELIRDRSRMSLVQANREVYEALKEGVKVSILDEEGEEERNETIRVIAVSYTHLRAHET